MLNILLTPFTFIIELLFKLSLIIGLNSPGIAILLLSIFVYLITLPLNKILNKVIEKEDSKKNKIKHLSQEIDSVYKGQTRYFYTKTLYRIHGISPWSDLLPILKLFIQIPFFLAAYYYLLDLDSLTGKSFLFFKDLSLADQLIPFGGIKLNLLPIVMFGINLLSSSIFAKENKNEKNALIGTGVLFLVLLYKMPAALVLYWTCNNLISLFTESLKSREWIREKISNFTLPKLFTNKYNIFALSYSLLLIVIIKYVYLLDYKSDTFNLTFGILITCITVLLVYISTSLVRVHSEMSTSNDLSFRSALFLFLGTYTPLFIYGRTNHEFIKDGLVQSFYFSLIIPSLISFIILYFILKKLKNSYSIISAIAATLVFFCLPMFNYKLSITAEESILYSVLFIVIGHLIVTRVDKKLINVFSYISLLAFIASCYDFVHIHNSRFKEESGITKKIISNPKTNHMYKIIQPKLQNIANVPSVYLLIYDGLTGPEVMNLYGLNYDLDFLKNDKFHVYGDILSNEETSVPTMSGILELSNKSILPVGSKQKKHVLGYNLVDNLFENINRDRTYMASDFFFKGKSNKAGSNIVSVGKKSINSLLEGVLIGEFKFDLEIKSSYEDTSWVSIRNKLIKDNKGFFYTHNPYPSHSQNSGKCQPSDISIYAKRRALAIKSIKEDIENIKQHNPNSIIIIAGDHGGHLSGDCRGMKSRGYKGVTLPIFAETKGTFLAIKWPEHDYKEYDKFTSLQGVFHSVFAYITKDKEILNYLPTEKICLGNFCTAQDGKVLEGKHKGQNIFDVLKEYKLEQL
jgi:YidC/Oxa1 family membrane protein insertase